MSKFQLGDLVKIRAEWKDNPNEDFTYAVVNVNETTDRYYIECIDAPSFQAYRPQSLVSGDMIEKA